MSHLAVLSHGLDSSPGKRSEFGHGGTSLSPSTGETGAGQQDWTGLYSENPFQKEEEEEERRGRKERKQMVRGRGTGNLQRRGEKGEKREKRAEEEGREGGGGETHAT